MTDHDRLRQFSPSRPGRAAALASRRLDRRRLTGGALRLGAAAALGATASATAAPTFAAPTVQDDGGLLPANRILTYYGYPGNDLMGILGEYDPDQLLAKLQDQASAYEDADPSRPVKMGFEVIASVAQRDPQASGQYIADTPKAILDEYTKFAGDNDILLFFDVQFGMRTAPDEVKGLEPWLKHPFVHLALDPEFKMHKGEIPGEEIGQIDASDITWTQEWLAGISQKYSIPPKVLLVHQFHYTMIENKDKLAPVAGVQLVINSDGFGTPEEKEATYKVMNTEHPIQFNGVKLFYKQDDPLMTPAQVLQLDPVPDVVIYQ